MLEHAAPLIKVTIVPRGQSLGAAWYLQKNLNSTSRPNARRNVCYYGRKSCWKVTFNRISTGALSDLEKVTKQGEHGYHLWAKR
jgi:cell division protease FtsH